MSDEQLVFHTEQRVVNDLVPYEFNPRRMTKEQVQYLETMLKKFGLVEIPVINLDNTICAGHQRLKVMKMLKRGKEVIDVRVPNRQMTKEEFEYYNVGSNKVHADFDMDMLANHFEMNMLMDIGFEPKDFDMSSKKETVGDDDVPEEVVSRTKTGDVYILKSHRLMCGDSTKLDDVKKLMGGGMADLIVTDPPYNVDYVGKTKDALKIKNDKMNNDQFYEFLLAVYKNLFEVSKDGAGIYVFHADSEGLNFRKALIDAGFKLAQCCIWVKQTMVMGRQDYHWQHEPVLYGWKPTGSHNWYTDRKQTTVWKFDRPSRSEDHPTTKPIALVEYPVCNSSKFTDIVLDLFGGSGSCMVACEKNNRINYSMELDAHYCDIIVKRYVDFCNKNSIPVKVSLNDKDITGELGVN